MQCARVDGGIFGLILGFEMNYVEIWYVPHGMRSADDNHLQLAALANIIKLIYTQLNMGWKMITRLPASKLDILRDIFTTTGPILGPQARDVVFC